MTGEVIQGPTPRPLGFPKAQSPGQRFRQVLVESVLGIRLKEPE